MQHINTIHRVPTGVSPEEFIAGFSLKALSGLGDISVIPHNKTSVKFVGMIKTVEDAKVLRKNLRRMQSPKVVKPVWNNPLALPAQKESSWWEHKQESINCHITSSLFKKDEFLASHFTRVSRTLDIVTYSYNFYVSSSKKLAILLPTWAGDYNFRYQLRYGGQGKVTEIACDSVRELCREVAGVIDSGELSYLEFDSKTLGIRFSK